MRRIYMYYANVFASFQLKFDENTSLAADYAIYANLVHRDFSC